MRPARPATLQPHPALRGAVLTYFAPEPVARSLTWRVLPDGCVDLVFNLSEARGVRAGVLEPYACVVGAMTSSVTIARPALSPVFGVTFAPEMAGALLGTAASLLTDQVIDLSDLWGNDATDLLDRLRDADTSEGRAQQMDAFLAHRLLLARRVDPILTAAVALIRACKGTMTMRAVSEELRVSERRLERLFRAGTGLSPKELARIIRLQGLLDRATRSAPSKLVWAGLACELGFADQAHMVREFRRLTGITPARYVRERNVNDYSNTVIVEALEIG